MAPTPRPLVHAACLATLALTATAPAQDGARRLAGSRPNILFIFSDDHAPHAISAYGSRINTTPNIDRLAAQGLLFRNSFCGNSICGPSRATILTGKHCHEHGFMRNGNRFDGDQTTFPKLLQQAGYTTAMIGKWHLTSDPTGFDHWMVLPGQGQYYNPDFLLPAGRERIEGHATNITTALAIDWLENGRDRDRPFLLMCQHKAPHRSWMPAPEDLALYRDTEIPEPATLFDDYAGRTAAARHQEMEIARHMYLHYDLKVPPTAAEAEHLQGPDRGWKGILDRMTPAQRETWDAAFAAENAAFRSDTPTGEDLVRWKYQRYIKNYLRCVAGVDRSVGELLDWLDAHPDVKQNTLVVYSSDQGFYLGDHGWYDKRWMYEESFKMPLIVAPPPGAIAAARRGTEVTELVQNIDYAPTFLELAGVPVPDAVQGESLVPLLEGRTPEDWRDAVYYHYYESHAVHMAPAHYGVRTKRYKLVRYYEPQWDDWELFDLERDPDELHDLAEDPDHADLLARLQARLQQLRVQYDDTTGALADGSFAVTAGIARATLQAGDGGVTLWANSTGGYLLRDAGAAGEAPTGTVTLTTTLSPLDGRQQQNGYVVLTGGDPRSQLVRAGVAFRTRQLQLVGPDGMKAQAETAIEWDGQTPVELVVTVDLAAHTITARALGQQVEGTVPAGWDALSAWGYGASNAETRFGPLRLQ